MFSQDENLPRRALSALFWLAAFAFASGLFLGTTLLLRDLPPTAPVAVGRVTIEKVSKARDYGTALLFFMIVPAGTIALFRLGSRHNERLRQRAGTDEGLRNLVSLLFVSPFFLAPFLYLTTFKWGWPLVLPLLLSLGAPRVVIAAHSTRWLRDLLSRQLVPFHSLIVVEALAWILFRYIGTGKRIAHIPTLFLEVVFVAFFVAAFWCALVLIARLSAFTIRMPVDRAFERITIAAMPLVVLPAMSLAFLGAGTAISIVMTLILVMLVVALRDSTAIDGRDVRNLTAFVILPILLYCLSYASTASLTQWIDLFHRGESLGPASDYLRGKVPYRDVFVLHGLMEDGQLDAWLMQLFGRNVAIALARPVILGSFAVPALWYVGLAAFDSVPLSLLVILLGAVTTVDNERVFFEIAVLALLLAGWQRHSRLLVALSGVVAAITLFFSYDIGLYSLGGALAFLVAAPFFAPASGTQDDVTSPRSAATKLASTLPMIGSFCLGAGAGAAPFLTYLALRGAAGSFFETSFVTLPRIIDAIWSLPFPDLTTTFRKDLNLHTISDFFLFEHFRFVLNPLVIGVALICLIQRRLSHKGNQLDAVLLALTTFALLTQRSALGRADFPHQYFSAFLIGPMIVILVVMFVRSVNVIWREGDRSAQAFLLAVGIAVLPLFLVVLWVPDIANGRLDDTIHYQGRVSSIGFVDPEAVEIRHRIDQVRYYVFSLSRRGAPIFDFSNQPAFYFFCDRPNPTRFYQVPILSPHEFQRETIMALERAKPPLVIRRSPQQFDVFDGVDNSIRAQAVAAYIDDHYAYARSVRGVELWQRKAASYRFDPDSYLRRIRIPTLRELNAVGSRSRLVFPAIGSLPGATGNYWRSDLILHNPFKESMSLDLRYVADLIRIDRRLTLAGGQSIRWEDVVKTLFGAPESRGVLWIDYRGAHGPVARVKTYDSAHSARASLDGPLSVRESAEAGGENSDLTLVGIPASTAGRRINIGFVNVGEIPATFRITVHTRRGETVGRQYEQGIAEDESVLLPDTESLLGVSLDETLTVHITMIAGRGLAYASVIDAEGDNQFIAAVPSPKL
ncbi:MAG: hypothetical protein ABI837_05140 [Acidobacteriota bacterium]